jgi:hypothetical protein
MAESLIFRDLSDEMSDLFADARALEMAISGSASLEPDESRALLHFAGQHLDAVRAVRDAVYAQHEAEVKARAEAKKETEQ